jgi:hypothetical protein
VDCEHTTPLEHPTGTATRPDFVALKKQTGENRRLYWSAFEATGEIKSGRSVPKAKAQGVSYTGFLLQARPDYISVQGIYVQPDAFMLVVTNACGTFSTPLLDWGPRPSRLLLSAWISCLYRPVNVDPSVTMQTVEGVPKFTINCGGAVYTNCSIRHAGSPFGRRTIVYNTDPQSELQKSMVIKEQYIKVDRRFEEHLILEKIHQDTDFPGVTRVVYSEAVKVDDNELVVEHGDEKRKKTRVIMQDTAGPLMDAETVRDALIAIYDLLEGEPFLDANSFLLIF